MDSPSTSWTLTSKEFSDYFSFFYEIVPEGELFSGSRARELLLLSNLPSSSLSTIWSLCDVDEDGQLNQAEFAIALHMTRLVMEGASLPSSLPSSLSEVVYKSVNPDDSISRAKTNQVLKCQSAFLSFCENINNIGYITAEAAQYLLTNSQLAKGHLFHIWKLSDIDRDGRLSFKEFVVAMHLIFVAKLGKHLPLSIDHQSLFPSDFESICKNVAGHVSRKTPVSQPSSVPPVPLCVIPMDLPSIATAFKSIPSSKFLDGKFTSFVGDPFHTSRLQENHPAIQMVAISSSQEELSERLPSLPHSESTEISKQSSSSHHSSVKSLVEERDQPKIHHVASIELISPVEKSRPEDHMEREEDVEEDEDEEKTLADLDRISKASEKFLSDVKGQIPTIVKQEYVAPEIKQIPPPAHVEITQLFHVEKKGTDTSKDKNEVDYLAQLDDLEAEILNVLDDTYTTSPPPTTSQPPKDPLPVINKGPLPVINRPPKPPKRDETDSVFTSKTLPPPKMRLSPSKKGKFRTSSDSSDEKRRNTVSVSPSRKKATVNVNRNSAILDDLDDLFSSELANIDSFLVSRKEEEKEKEERKKKEIEELTKMEKKAKEGPDLPSLSVSNAEELLEKRRQESAQRLKEWEEEVKKMETDAEALHQQKKKRLVDEATLKELEEEWNKIIEQETKNVMESSTIRAQRMQKEEAERQRQEEMRKKVIADKQALSIEEWIQMMEENKMNEMTEEEKEKYMERKKAWIERRKAKEEKERQIMEEKLLKSRERMANEIVRLRNIEDEVKKNRLDEDQLKELEEEMTKKEVIERKMRIEQAKQRKEENIQREIEENKPKARSALAARWEEQVKTTRNARDYKKTVLTGSPIKETTSTTKEEERLARRVGKIM